MFDALCSPTGVILQKKFCSSTDLICSHLRCPRVISLKLCLLLELCILFSLFIHVFPEAVCLWTHCVSHGVSVFFSLSHYSIIFWRILISYQTSEGQQQVSVWVCFHYFFLINWKFKKQHFEESLSLSKIFIAYRLLITSVFSLLNSWTPLNVISTKL